MSFETITVVRQFPVINNFVQLPNNLEKNVTAVSLEEALVALPTAVMGHLTVGIGGRRLAGGKFGIQEWLETEEALSCCPTPVDDDAETLKDEIPNNSTRPTWDRPPPGDREWNEDLEGPCDADCRSLTDPILLTWNGTIVGRICCHPSMVATQVTLTTSQPCIWTASQGGYFFTIELITSRDGTCYWLLTIVCEQDLDMVWSGVKLVGSTPSGNYVSNDPSLCGAAQLTNVAVSAVFIWI